MRKIEEFPSFLNREDDEMAETLRQLQQKQAAELVASGKLAGWAEWPDG